MNFDRIVAVAFNLLLTLGAVLSQDDNPIIQTAAGLVRGFYSPDAIGENASYYAFLGIPYAEPPVGDLRFRAPVARSPWEGVLDALEYGSQCLQFATVHELTTPTGDENCLYFNVFIPELPNNATDLKPILVWIHGGEFILSNGIIGADFVISEDVIVVSFNYRLDVLGYFSTDDEAAPGNYALKDKILALRWVQDNIQAFGGDPAKVTILGASSGAVATQYLVQSRATEGLFRAAVSMSGSTLDEWALQKDPRTFAFKMGDGFGIQTNDSFELVERLRELDAVDLFIGSYVYTRPTYILGPLPFFPTIEPDLPGAVVTESSYKTLSEGTYQKVPYILGTVSADGLLIYSYIGEGLLDLPDYVSRVQNFLSSSLNMNPDSEVAAAVGRYIRDFYYGLDPDYSATNLVNHWTDEVFRRGVRKSVELLKTSVPVYYYVFTYPGAIQGDAVGVRHGGDLPYLWNYGLPETDEDHLVRQREVRLITNFVKTLNPTPEEDPLLNNIIWQPAGDEDHYLEITDQLLPGVGFQNNHLQFWQYCFDWFGLPPFYTW